MDRPTVIWPAIVFLLRCIVVDGSHVEPIYAGVGASKLSLLSDSVPAQPNGRSAKASADLDSVPFCNDARRRRRGPAAEADSGDRSCRRELRQHSPAEFGALLDAALEDFEESAAPCFRQPAGCTAGRRLDSLLVNADQPTSFPYWDWRLDVDLDSEPNAFDLAAVKEFLRDALRFVGLSRFLDEDLAAAVRNFTESTLANRPDLGTVIRATVDDDSDGRSNGLDVSQVLRLLLAVSIDERLAEYDAEFDRIQCAAAERWLSWDEPSGRCLARWPLNPTPIVSTVQSPTDTVASVETTLNWKNENDQIYSTVIPSTVDASDADYRHTVNKSANSTVNENEDNLPNFSEKTTDADTVDYVTNPLRYSKLDSNTVDKKYALTQTLTVNSSDIVNGSVDGTVTDDTVDADYDQEIDEFMVNLVLSAIQSPAKPADTVKMVAKPNTVESIDTTNLWSENTVNTTEIPTSMPTTVVDTTPANPTVLAIVAETAIPYYVGNRIATVNNSTKYRKPNGKTHKKQRKHKKAKKLTTTTTTTTTVPTTTVADDDDDDSDYSTTTTVANGYWPRKKSGYYKFDRKYLSKYRNAAPPSASEYRSSSEASVALDDGNWNAMADKNSNGRYIIDTKYNFPEEKSTHNSLNSEKSLYGSKDSKLSVHGNHEPVPSVYGGNFRNTVNVTFDSAVDYQTVTSYRTPTTIGTVAVGSPEVDPENHLDRLIKYLPKPKLPKGTIRWRSHTVPIPMAYFTITVIQGALSRQRRQPSTAAKRRVAGAQVYVTGLNMPTGYTQITEGHQLKGSSGVVLRTLNPRSSGPFVEFKVRVVNRLGKSCRQLCLDGSQRYRRCARRAVRLSVHRRFSDPIPFYQSAMDAIDGQWIGRGYYRRRKPDYLLFRCD